MTAGLSTSFSQLHARDHLIVALDVDCAEAAREIVGTLRDEVTWFKIGSQLFTRTGGELVRELADAGKRVFLDLKFHDIPNTVAGASREAVRLGVAMFNVHAIGGTAMMRAGIEATQRAARDFAVAPPMLIAVTLLTSHDSATLEEIGWHADLQGGVRRLAKLAAAAKLNGVVASAQEIEVLREDATTRDLLCVTPGIRFQDSTADDQKRIMTPRAAIARGADFLVMGRAITAASDMNQAVRRALDEIENGRRDLLMTNPDG